MINNDTVFALSTPVGGAIAIMRISGPDARRALETVFTGRIEPRRISYGSVTDPDGSKIDSCCAVFFEAPASYTGEDMAEIYCHGSRAVAVRLTERLMSVGFLRPAEAGEFTKRAYLSGKMDLAQAEAVMDLIYARAERSRKAALGQLEGRLSAVISDLYSRAKIALAELANYLEDDTDEVSLDAPALKNRIEELGSGIRSLAANGMRSRILRDGARVAIIGSPNVGKSSLLNALLLRERAIVTPVPGTTRDTLEEDLAIDGIPVVLVDTAGICETPDTVESMGVARSRREAEDADLVLWLADGTRELSDGDREILGSLSGKRTVAVITKADLDSVFFPDDNGTFCSFPAVRTSAVTGEGLTALKKLVADNLLPGGTDGAEDLITNSRHISALEGAADSLSDAADALTAGNFDGAFFSLHEAMESLASILGKDDPTEDLVDSIFADFCMGK
ncbi:MAG: tRNA uridine-5-carboxymethylaminomethyl(34) synthesis GTPase MnmE [Clostridiales bacterium]|nr:tRNA uridine-5-carboxymethylaminomethyl(34) synthesis GTPase MnmE [Clostridiales bacterium]